MEKRKITSFSRLSGVCLGVTLALLMFVLSISAVITNGDFWLKQNDRYKHGENFKLVSNDHYNALYHHYIALLKGDEAPDKSQTVTLQSDPEEFTNTFVTLNGFLGLKDTEYHFEETVAINQEFLQTVSRYAESKGDSLKGNLRFQFTFNLKDNDEIQDMLLSIKNISVTDEDGKEYQYSLNKFFYNEAGALISQEIEDALNVEFKSNYVLGIVIFDEISASTLNVKLDVKSDLSEYDCASVFTYKEKLTNVDVAKQVGYEADVLTYEERLQLASAGNISLIQKIIAAVLVILAVILVIVNVKKQKREALFGIGFYTFVSAIIVAVIINVLVNAVPSEWGFNLVFDFAPQSTSSVLMGQNFMSDFTSGSVRFYDFTMIAPLFIGYVLAKISKSNKEDPNEDYLYQ